MIRDLRTILDGWEYEPGKISVRKIIGRDGREKLQTRIDMGVLQLEAVGRPDGKRPHNCETLLEHFERQRTRAQRESGESDGAEDDFVLSPEDTRELRHEAYLFYQRFLSLFVLEEFDAVERDTGHSLRLIEFCERYALPDTDRAAVCAQKGYVLMMNARARAYREASAGRFEPALTALARGIRALEDLSAAASDERPAPSVESELRTLREQLEDIYGRMPPEAPARIQRDLDLAIEREDYEAAARLRDRLAFARQRCA